MEQQNFCSQSHLIETNVKLGVSKKLGRQDSNIGAKAQEGRRSWNIGGLPKYGPTWAVYTRQGDREVEAQKKPRTIKAPKSNTRIKSYKPLLLTLDGIIS